MLNKMVLLCRFLFSRFVGCAGWVRTVQDPLNQIRTVPLLMISTSNDAAFDWCPVFHHPANEPRVSRCGGVISPSQLEDSDRDEKRRKITEREKRNRRERESVRE